jgi:hypothetical protein
MMHVMQAITKDDTKFGKAMLTLAIAFAGALAAAVAIVAHL